MTGKPCPTSRQMLKQLFGHEWHEWMQQLYSFGQDMCGTGTRFDLRSLVLAAEHRLEQFQIPVANLIPDKTVERAGSFVELICLDCGLHLTGSPRQFGENPAIDRQLRRRWIKGRVQHRPVHVGKPHCIPQLGSKIPVAGNPRRIEFHITSLCCHDCQSKPQGVSSVFIN